MILEWIRFAVSAALLLTGLVFMILAVFGVNRFNRALNRMHAAAMGDTLGILFVIMGHMISRLEAMTNRDLGEIIMIHRETKQKEGERG